MANGLYSKIKPKFDALLEGKDPNDVSAVQWHTEVAKAIKEFIEERVKVMCAYSGVLPPPTSTPDPISSDVWGANVTLFTIPTPVDFNTWVASLSTLIKVNTKILGAGAAGVTLSGAMSPVIGGTLTIPQASLQNKTTEEIWNFIGDCILSWIRNNPAGATTQAVHGAYSGPAVQSQNIA